MRGSSIGAGLVVGTICLSVGSVSRAAIFFPGTGSYYDLVVTKTTWAAAKSAAEGTTIAGRPGRLATITSAAENSFIVATFLSGGNNGDSFWLGGVQPAGSPEPAGGWQWISGEPFVYVNWDSGEPNDFNYLSYVGEDRIELYNAASGSASGKWNDIHHDNFQLSEGYVIEYVPEPASSTAAIAAAVVAVAARPRSRRRG